MIPEGRLSTTPVVAPFMEAQKQVPLIDYEKGGVGLNNPTQGLQVQTWTLRYDRASGNMRLSAPNTPEFTLWNRPDITEVSLAFDQNMNPFVAFVQAGVAKFWWYDPTIPGQTFAESLLGTAITPRATMDEKRATQSAVSDIILGYMRNNNLCYRIQRERYLTEHVLRTGCGGKLADIGRNTGYRLQFKLTDTTDPAMKPAGPYLADVILDLCARAGIRSDSIDVSECYDDIVMGLKVNTKEGINTVLKPVLMAFRVDAAEFDKRLHFYKRGRSPIVRIRWDELATDNPSSMQMTRVQEDKLPRRINVAHLDPDGGYANNKQYAHRKSNMVNAKSEETLEPGFVMTADQAAELAMITLKQRWYEQMTYKFKLPMKYTYLTAADTFEFEDKDGTIHTIRIDERNTADGIICCEGTQDGGALAYNTKVTGLPLDPPKSTTPGIIGETRLEIINTSPWSDANDKIGLHIAVAGESSGWYGCDLIGSTDGGVTYTDLARIETPATLGETTTAIVDEADPTYSADQSVTVQSNFALESSPEGQLLLILVGDELMYYRNAVPLGSGLYRLTGLVRGRYNTAIESWPVDSRFVFIDTSVTFVEMPRFTIGMELYVKPVSLGLTEDETVPVTYDFDPCYSQTEWAPTNVEASRDVSDNVTVTFIGRARFGIESNPYDGTFFRGYRIKFSDGFSFDTYDETYTRATTPDPVTVTVCALNEITGESQLSAGVTV